MNLHKRPRVRHDRQCGQTLVLVPLMLVVLLAICALAIDLGNVYVCYQALKSSTNAAALAAGEAIPWAVSTATDPVTVAKQYSGSPANGAIYNLHPNFLIDTVTPTPKCISTTTYPNLGLLPCNTYYGPDGNINAIQVTETGKVPTYFAKIFGVTSVPISATATASASGGAHPPYDIMLVLDTTASMGSGQDTGCISGKTSLKLSPEQCAQEGIQTLLSGLTPCGAALGNCPTSTSGLGTNAVDEVGLMVFPGLTASQTANLTDTTAGATANKDYSCPASSPSITAYNNNPQYLILPFQNDFRVSAGSALNLGSGGSNLLKAVGGVTNGTCTGAQTPGGEGTFYAGVIIAAQDYLTANSRTGAKNVMILLSDGDATASPSQMGGTTKQTVAIGGMNGSLFASTAECTQAVNAANYAKAAGTLIYSISYGSANTGCNTGGETYKTPCATMSAIASTPTAQYFYSVPQTVGGKTSTVCTGAAPITSLDQVFTDIQNKLSTSRLIPNGL